MASVNCAKCGAENPASAMVCGRCHVAMTVLRGAQGAGTVYSPPPLRRVVPESRGVVKSKQLLVVVAVIGVCALVAMAGAFLWRSADAPLEWRQVEAPAANYKFMMPGNPSRVNYEIPSVSDSKIVLYGFESIVPGQGKVSLGSADFPDNGRVPIDGTELLEKMLPELVTGMKCELTSRKEIRLSNGYPGIEFEARPPRGTSGNSVLGQIYWVRPRIYLAFTEAKEDSRLWKERRIFADSLTFAR